MKPPMTATTAHSLSICASSISTPMLKPHKPIDSHLCIVSFSNITNPTRPLLRWKVSGTRPVPTTRASRVLVVSESNSEAELSDSNKKATIDIKLPRRSLLVQFTCDECGERTQRLINRLAYERGLVYVQCAGCLRHHKLVDNLGLVVEYDLQKEISLESNTDQV